MRARVISMAFCPIFGKVEFSRHILPKPSNTELHINSSGESRVILCGKQTNGHRETNKTNSLFQILRKRLKTSSNTNGPPGKSSWHRCAPRCSTVRPPESAKIQTADFAFRWIRKKNKLINSHNVSSRVPRTQRKILAPWRDTVCNFSSVGI